MWKIFSETENREYTSCFLLYLKFLTCLFFRLCVVGYFCVCVAIGDELSYEFFSKVIIANIQHLLHTDSILSTIPKGKMTIFSILYLLSII